MITTTRGQRLALKRLFERSPIDADHHRLEPLEGVPISYRQFRRGVRPMFGGQGCILVQWCGMWVGIEPDGYTHT